MAQAFDAEILAIGRDALVWIDKIKKLHSQIMKTTVYVDFFEYNVAAVLKAHFNRIKAEGEALDTSIEMLKKGEVPPAICLSHIEKIKKSYINILYVARALLKALKAMEGGVVKELEEAAYIKTDLAGLESLVWRINEDIEINRDRRAHIAVRRLISMTRYGERKEKKMTAHIKDVIERIRGMKKRLETMIIPNIIGGIFDELGKKTTELVPAIVSYKNRGDMEGMANFLGLFARAAKQCGMALTKNGLMNVANDYKALIGKMDSLKGEIDKFEAREGALVKELEKAIGSYERKGYLKRVAA